MNELAMTLRGRRLENGSLELVLPEIKLELNDEGQVCGARVVRHTPSHQIIEEFMLAANEGVAEQLTRQELLFLRRIHAPPSPLRLRDLTVFVRQLGLECESLESRFEIRRVLEQVAGQPLEAAVNYAVLRSMQKAVYGPETERHYALNKTHYCHFTSPIRRYPDLTVHRLLDQLARGKRPRNDLAELTQLGEHCSQREQLAAEAERELIKIKLLHYLSDHVGLVMDGVITGVEDFGLFVQGVELPAEGLIHISSLQDDYYHHDAAAHSLVGRRAGRQYRLGDLVKVEVLRVDVERRELDYRLVTPGGVPPPRASQSAAAAPAIGVGPASGRGGARDAAGARRDRRPGNASPFGYNVGKCVFVDILIRRGTSAWQTIDSKPRCTPGTLPITGAWSNSPAGRCRSNTRRLSTSMWPLGPPRDCSISPTWDASSSRAPTR